MTKFKWKVLTKIAVVVPIILTSLSGIAANGGGGVGDGGGGSDVVAEFIVRANSLLTRLSISNPETPELQVLKGLIARPGLKTLPVDNLKDMVTGQAIPDQSGLIAYGQPGFIQLRTQVWDQAFRADKNMDHHIFHELCRAAAPKCNDESYRISIVQLHLAPSSYAPQIPASSTPDQMMKLAVEQGDENSIKQAIQNGLKLEQDIRTVAGTSFSSSELLTPLAYAALIGNDRSIEILLKLGAQVNYVDGFHQTALHRAAAFNHSSSIRLLVSNSAALEPQTFENYGSGPRLIPTGEANIPTPLMVTINTGAIEAAKTLLELGAKTDYPWPVRAPNERLDSYNNSENIDSPLGEAVAKEKLSFVKLFVAYHANVDRPFWGCWAPLLCAANSGNLEITEFLIRSGANVNEVDSLKNPANGKIMQEYTPLTLAKNLLVAELLVRHGANARYISKNGNTALNSRVDASLSLTEFLIRNGTPLNTVENDGVGDPPRTALDAAELGKNQDVVRYLRSIGAKRAIEIRSSSLNQ